MSALHSHLAICIEALTIKILLSAGQLVHGCVMGFGFFTLVCREDRKMNPNIKYRV